MQIASLSTDCDAGIVGLTPTRGRRLPMHCSVQSNHGKHWHEEGRKAFQGIATLITRANATTNVTLEDLFHVMALVRPRCVCHFCQQLMRMESALEPNHHSTGQDVSRALLCTSRAALMPTVARDYKLEPTACRGPHARSRQRLTGACTRYRGLSCCWLAQFV